MNIKTYTTTMEIGSKDTDRKCRVRAIRLDGQPHIYHITAKQENRAKKRCGISGGDRLVRYGVKNDTRLLVIGGDTPTEIYWN